VAGIRRSASNAAIVTDFEATQPGPIRSASESRLPPINDAHCVARLRPAHGARKASKLRPSALPRGALGVLAHAREMCDGPLTSQVHHHYHLHYHVFPQAAEEGVGAAGNALASLGSGPTAATDIQ